MQLSYYNILVLYLLRKQFTFLGWPINNKLSRLVYNNITIHFPMGYHPIKHVTRDPLLAYCSFKVVPLYTTLAQH